MYDLFSLPQQLDLSSDKLEKLSFVVEAMRDNLVEFSELSEKISAIIEEVKILAAIEEEVVSSCSDLARNWLSVTPQQTTSSSDVESIVSIVNAMPSIHLKAATITSTNNPLCVFARAVF